MSSLNSYIGEIEKALRHKEQFVNYNKDIQHATVVICTAMHHAESRVRLLSNRLDPVLYGGQWFLMEAEAFLGQEDASLDILVETDMAQDHPLRGLLKQHKDKVSVGRVPDNEQTYGYNFMLVDGMGYRFERDRDKHEALVAFHADVNESFRAVVSILDKMFDSLSAAAEPVAI